MPEQPAHLSFMRMLIGIPIDLTLCNNHNVRGCVVSATRYACAFGPQSE